MQLHLVSSTAAPAYRPHLTALVRADFTFDIPAIKAGARARYALKQEFINRYTGEPRRYWQRAISRRVLGQAWKEAREQRHRAIWSHLPRPLPYTTDELRRMVVLLDLMRAAPISGQGNADYREAASEYGAISERAQKRAYAAILARVSGR